jgi:hypothetical protein
MGSSRLAVIAILSKDHNAPLAMPPNILTILLVTGPGWRRLDETTVVTDIVAKIFAEGSESQICHVTLTKRCTCMLNPVSRSQISQTRAIVSLE